MAITLLILSILMTGCGTTAHRKDSQNPTELLQRACLAFDDGDITISKVLVRDVLDKTPDEPEAQMLMARIIDREIENARESESEKFVEEFDEEEKRDAVRTWLERAKTLLEIKYYDEAVLAAEKVFVHEPNNVEASKLIDEIKRSAIREGKQESIILKKMHQEEIGIRIKTYTEQAQKWLAAGPGGGPAPPLS